MKKNKIVIVLVNYNTNGDTLDCIKSIQKSVGVELPFIVLVDNNSKNAKELACFKEEYEQLHIIYNEENLGFGRANNKGIRWAQKNINFEYLLLLNNDTIIKSDSLFYLKKAFKKDSKIGITTSKIMYEGQRDIVWYGGGFINYLKGFPKIDDFNEKVSTDKAELSKYVTFISGCTMMFSKESIQKIGGFDDKYFMYCEDLDLCMKAMDLGYKLYYESNSVIYHKVNASNKKDSDSATGLSAKNTNAFFIYYHIRSNQYYTMRKNLAVKYFIVFNLFFLFSLIKTIIQMTIYGRFDVIKHTCKILVNIYKNTTAK